MKILTISKYITDCNEPLTLHITYFTSTSRHRKIQNFQSKVLDDLIQFMTSLFIFVSLCQQTTHCDMKKMMMS